MPRPAPVRQADLTRYAKAMRAAGYDDLRVEIDPTTGKVNIWTGRGATDPDAANPCDELLR